MPVWRVRDRRSFEQLRLLGHRHRSGPVTLTSLPLDDGLPPRVAYAVGKAVGPAVTRNRVRRRLRAIARELDLPSGIYLLSVGPEAAALDFPTLSAHVRAASAP